MDLSCQKLGIKIHNSLGGNINIVTSPLSIYAALTMLLPGAQNETLTDIMRVINYDDNDISNLHSELSSVFKRYSSMECKSKNCVNFVCKLFADKTCKLLNSYVDFMNYYYVNNVEYKNFMNEEENSRVEINNWVDEETEGKIKDLLPNKSISKDTRVVLVNAIYFKGYWKETFISKGVKKFKAIDGCQINIETMDRKSKTNILKINSLEASVVSLEFQCYEGGKTFDMFIILPNKESDLKYTESHLTEEILSEIINAENKTDKIINIQLPKFKINYRTNMKKCLTELGMGIAFSDKANFNMMSENEGLYVDEIFHQACIEINEAGAETGTGSGVAMETGPQPFICDRPFLFIICNKSVPLFFGRFTGK